MEEASPFPLPQLCLALPFLTPGLTLSPSDFIPLGIHPCHLLRPRQTLPCFRQRCSALASAAEGGVERVYCGLRTDPF